MIVDDLRSESRGGRTRSSARLGWAGGESRLEVTLPRELAPDRADASPFLCPAILLAMQLDEDLEVRGPVSGPLLERAPRIVDLYASWDPRLRRSGVSASTVLAPRPRAEGVASFLSRGVDSLFSAAAPRALPGPITGLVFCDRLEPAHGEEVRAEEIRLAGEAADRLGLPLHVIDSNVRELTDPIVGDWVDVVGAALAFLGTSMAGVFGHVVIPSSDGPMTVAPVGSSPVLDPLFSTAQVEVVHDSPGTRPAKVAWLARERPDLLPLLKVCFREDRPDNCGRCSKCLLTMLALEAVGSLGEATGFPPEIGRDALLSLRVRGLQPVEEFREVERALREGPGGGELADLCAEAIARGAELPPQERYPEGTPGFLRRRWRPGPEPARAAAPLAAVVVAGEPGPALDSTVESVLAQSASELKLIVVGEGPVGRDRRLRVIGRPRTGGRPGALNAALRDARAPLIAPLDPGAVLEPDYLESILPLFEDPGVGLAFAAANANATDTFPDLAVRNPVPPSTATMRSAAVRAAGGWAWWLRGAEDHHLLMKLAHAGWRFAHVDRPLARGPSAGVRGERAMLASFALRHPRTPGPRRLLRVAARDALSRRPPAG